MQPPIRTLLLPLIALAFVHATPAWADDPDADALALTSAPVTPTASPHATRFFVEGAIGRADQRNPSGWRNLDRLSADFSSSMRLAPEWRAVISDRLDSTRPATAGAASTVNSLREAYVSWQQADGATLADLGRVNLRYGPAYGYNPTDFFRHNTLRTITTVDPLALRENRLGTFMVRGQKLWGDNAVSLSYAPKLANEASNSGFSADVGATNDRDRALLTFTTRVSERIGGQLLLYKQSRQPAAIGASMTALLADSLIFYAEGSRGKEPDLATRAQFGNAPRPNRNRFAGGMTFTPFPSLSLTGEYEYNGFALDRSGWTQVTAAGATATIPYLIEAQRSQEISSRDALFAYATLKDAGTKNLDVTALLRVNGNDHSRLAWLELRRHWQSVDLAVQLQQQNGGLASEYGLSPYRRSVQLLASYNLE